MKLVAFSQLQAKQVHDIVDRVASVFSSPVLAVLNSCDTLLDMCEQQKRYDDVAMQRQSEVLHDGMRVTPSPARLSRRSWAFPRAGK